MILDVCISIYIVCLSHSCAQWLICSGQAVQLQSIQSFPAYICLLTISTIFKISDLTILKKK